MSFENLSYIVVGLVHIYIVGGSREVKGGGGGGGGGWNHSTFMGYKESKSCKGRRRN